MKKLYTIVLMVLLSFGLFSCIELIPIGEYESEVVYEQKIMSVTSSINGSNISLVENRANAKPRKSLASAVIIHKEEIEFESSNYYYAITIGNIFENDKVVGVYLGDNQTVDIIDYAINYKYNIAIIKFKSKAKLKKAKVFKEDQTFDVFVGQTILSLGTDSNLSYFDTTKQGVVSNDKFEYNYQVNEYFTHDASINAGEKGSGIYNLAGYLVGINIDKVYKNENISTEENILGLNYALKISVIDQLFKNIKNIDYQNNTIDNNFVTSNNEIASYEEDDYEQKIKAVYEANKNSVVTLENNQFISSGLLIKQEGNIYQILTSHISPEIANGLTVRVGENVKEIIDVNNISSDISIVTFSLGEQLEVYNLDNNFEQLTRGQTVITIGSIIAELPKSLNIGTLSTTEFNEDYIFMHSTKANKAQIGGPIFNLNGNLVGIHLEKVNDIDVSDGKILAEGLSYAYNIYNIIDQLTDEEISLVDYESPNVYEQQVIDVTRDVFEKTVTVKTNKGHGSGILFRKEKLKDGKNRYSVLTNEHVISTLEGSSIVIADEISVSFNFDLNPIRVDDYYFNKNLDMGIVRFTSEEDIEVMNSKVFDRSQKQETAAGQIVIAMGTPENVNRIGYTTTGILTRKSNTYLEKAYLGLTHTAALNPGNSGGPLFSLKGELIGINTAKGTNSYTEEGQVYSEGIGISLNVNLLGDVYNSVLTPIKYNEMGPRTPRIGITVISLDNFNEAYPNEVSNLAPATYGIVVVDVDPLFDVFGKLEVYDVIIEINGTAIHTNDDVPPLVAGKPLGTLLVVKVLRKGHPEPLVIEVRLS